MPIYEYACQACQARFEVKQAVNDPPLSTCTRCGGEVVKLISAPAIMFKGSGWYVTDYSDKLKPPASPGEPAPAKAGADGDGKKPAAAGDGGSAAPAKAPPTTSGNGNTSGGSSPSSSSPAPSGSSAPSSS